MRTKPSHLSDEEILLFVDRELPSWRQLHARGHLAECPTCSGRRAELEGALADFSHIHEEAINSLDSRLLRSRSLLKARIEESISRGKQGWSSRLLVDSMSRQLVYAGVALVIVATGYWIAREQISKYFGRHSNEYQAFDLPRSTLTPGATLQISVEELCNNRVVDNDPPVNEAVHQTVFLEYGLTSSSRNAYAVDYLITPALGGSNDIKNLWPQPYSSTWNARVKDQLEDHLHQLVCQRKIQLATAQEAIATDWISAYKRYFDTDKPQPNATTLAVADSESEFRLAGFTRPY